MMRLAGLMGGGKSKSLSFEVQVFKTDHWVTEQICDTEQDARALAAKILPQREGVRVLREFRKPNGETTESVLFSEMGTVTKRPISIVAIEEAPVCQSQQDYLGLDSRQTITRILRQYLEDKALTASELLHHPGEMKRVMNFEALAPNAISRIATLQVKSTGEDVKARRDNIYTMVDQLRVRAEKAPKDLPSVKKTGLASAMAQVEQVAGGNVEETDYLAKVMLCRDLVNVRNLLGKIEYILEICGGEAVDPKHMAILDALVADAMGSTSVVQDMLGRQTSLIQAIQRTMDILDGTFEPLEREQAPPVTALLSRWLASGLAPQTQLILVDFVCRNIGGKQRLTAGEPSEQRAAYKLLIQKVTGSPGHFYGGPRMAEALTQGMLRFLEAGGAEGRRQAIDGMLSMFDLSGNRLLYLINLAGSDLGRREMELVVFRSKSLLSNQAGLHGIVPATMQLKPKMQFISSLYRQIADCEMPEAERAALADRIDEHVTEYIKTSKLIDKLDDPTASLRIRATRLIQFAAADILSSPKARKMVRDQVVGHLRQPNFDGKFIEGIEHPEEQVKALKSFYAMLTNAQFM
jgi:hypothetical protein